MGTSPRPSAVTHWATLFFDDVFTMAIAIHYLQRVKARLTWDHAEGSLFRPCSLSEAAQVSPRSALAKPICEASEISPPTYGPPGQSSRRTATSMCLRGNGVECGMP